MFETVVAPGGTVEGGVEGVEGGVDGSDGGVEGDVDEGLEGEDGTGVDGVEAEAAEVTGNAPPHPVSPSAQTASINQKNVFIG
ncbi:MAG TPA: hypothetical protein VGG26_08790 [Terracidiphilus sp.]|jgi:hypothetical protein